MRALYARPYLSPNQTTCMKSLHVRLSSITICHLLVNHHQFFYALIFTSTLAAKTVPVAIAEFIGRYVVNINGMMAGGILAAIPPVLVALIFQRYIVSGMTAGAVKG